MASTKPARREEFEIAIICALPLEYNAVCLLFDEFWDKDGDHYGRASGDVNSYTTGRIGKFNVVLTLLSRMGKKNATVVATGIRSSYGGVRLTLLVGICGAVPRTSQGDEIIEILLGDVIVSKTVVQYDFGRQYPDKFVRKDTIEDNLSKPNKDIRNLLTTFETNLGLERLQERTAHFLKQLQANAAGKRFQRSYSYPGTAEDKLFESTYRHKHHVSPKCICRHCNGKSDPVCDKALDSYCVDLGCDKLDPRSRKRLEAKRQLEQDNSDEAQEPTVYVGSVASGDTVMKSGEDRDRIAMKEGTIAFEMEGAGVWEEVPCIIVRGVCDYADCHKNKKWQNFAAATAASTSKAILERYVQTDNPSRGGTEASRKELISQGGSKYSADVKGKGVTQGNEMEISSSGTLRDYKQDGSEFGGNIQARGLVIQGNKFRI
jgi:nucleoside phosphorylase